MEPGPIIVVCLFVAVVLAAVLFAIFTYGDSDEAAKSGSLGAEVAPKAMPPVPPAPPAATDPGAAAVVTPGSSPNTAPSTATTTTGKGSGAHNPPPSKGVTVLGAAPAGNVGARKAEIEAGQAPYNPDKATWSWKMVKGREYLMPKDATQDEIDWLVNTESLLNQVAVWAKKNRPSDKMTARIVSLFSDPALSRITMKTDTPNTTSVSWAITPPFGPMIAFGRYGPYWASFNKMTPNPVLMGHIFHEFGHIAAGPEAGHGSGI